MSRVRPILFNTPMTEGTGETTMKIILAAVIEVAMILLMPTGVGEKNQRKKGKGLVWLNITNI